MKGMNDMEEFAIYCTENQAKKAKELGAPIGYRYNCKSFIDIPTAEQMIGWLESLRYFDSIAVYHNMDGWRYSIFHSTEVFSFSSGNNFESRKDAELCAINVSLEYLEKIQKKEKDSK